MNLTPIQKVGESKSGTLSLIYPEVVKLIGTPNATKLDDADKVKASWGFKDDQGREGFVWAYRWSGSVKKCDAFSVDGDGELLKEIFGSYVSFY